mgnify:CR=1 FL=1
MAIRSVTEVARNGQASAALARSLEGGEWKGEDQAAIALAVRLARELDACQDWVMIGTLSRRLLDSLNSLRLTPDSRMKGAKSGEQPPRSALDQLKDRREDRRKRRAEAVDSAPG